MQEGITPRKIDYSWIEIAPLLIVLFLVVIALSIIPNCLDRDSCVEHVVSQNIDVHKLSVELNKSDNLFSMMNVEKP